MGYFSVIYLGFFFSTRADMQDIFAVHSLHLIEEKWIYCSYLLEVGHFYTIMLDFFKE